MDDPDTTADQRRLPVAAAAMPAPGLVALLAGAVVVAALYLGRELFVPMVLAVLLAFVLAPLVRMLRRLRLGDAPSVLVAVAVGFGALLGIGLVVARQISQLAANVAAYQAAIRRKIADLRLDELLGQAASIMRDLDGGLGHGGASPAVLPPVPGSAPAPVPLPAPPAAAAHGAAPGPLEVLRSVAEPLLEPLATTAIVVVLVIFFLLYREDLRDRLIRLAGSRDLHRTMGALNDAAHRLSRFFLAQVALNAGFGLFIAGGLWLLGLPNPVLWGILAGLMRFVPFIGVFVAVVPPVLLALAVDPGWSLAFWVLGLFALSEPLMGQVAEPLLYGHSTGLSPVSVIIATAFWAFLWGPIGLLLATPLTVCLVVLGRHVNRLEFLEVMLGDRPPLLPEEILYQRALEGDADGLVRQARRHLKEAPLAAYYDGVALRALALAQTDWSREVLEPERLDGVHRQFETMLDDLAEGAEPAPGGVPAGWEKDGAVICVAGRGQFDDLAAQMAVQLLRGAGFGARPLPNAALGEAGLERLDPARVRLCCLSMLEEGSSAAGVRYFLRRLRRRLPEAVVVVGLWHARPDSPTLAALREEGPGETTVTSLREAVAFCQAAAAQAARETAAEAAPRAS
jgi:predicted PurR-regulated permease PerM